MKPAARAVVRAAAVAPRDDAELLRTERGEIRGAVHDVLRQRRDFLFHCGESARAGRVGQLGVLRRLTFRGRAVGHGLRSRDGYTEQQQRRAGTEL